ncbi:hypothetical protein AWN76_013100 [Rhodothermaceae bacterium RA]|nr:hypothetical protein AWN76_013100 [Rhodothermaceae bacterium RA]
MPYSTIAVALACKPDEKPVIDEAVRLSRALGARLVAIHVNDPLEGKISMMMDYAGPKETVEDIRQQFREAGYPDVAETLDVHILTGKDFAEAIAEATKDADLLVLGHRKMGRLRAMISDSTDEDIANLVECPVLIVTKNPTEAD